MTESNVVLVAYLPGAMGEAAFEAGLELAKEKATRLLVVNSPKAGSLVDARMLDEAGISTLIERGKKMEIEVEVVQPPNEDPVDAISDLIATNRFSVLVIGIRKRSSVGKLLMGSTAQRLLLELPIPILAVKP